MRISKLAAAALTLLVLGGCVTQGNEKQLAGTLLGAGLGGLAGSKIGGGKGQLAAVAVGTLAGAAIGRGIGESLDNVDRLYAERAQAGAAQAPVGQPVAWNNPDTGHRGTVTAVRDGVHTGTGAYCREYRTTVDIGGRTETAYGTSCRQPDGTWQIVN
ncbi:MAG: RT0821/Lpp0805 family surface protein [Rhodospirillales bacterium]